MVHGTAYALVAEVFDDGQAFDAPATSQTVIDEAHTLHLGDRSAAVRRHTFKLQTLGAAPFTCPVGSTSYPEAQIQASLPCMSPRLAGYM